MYNTIDIIINATLYTFLNLKNKRLNKATKITKKIKNNKKDILNTTLKPK